MKPKKKPILRVLEQSTVPLTFKQVSHFLGIKKSHKHDLKALLLQMAAKGKILRKNGKYSLLGMPEGSPPQKMLISRSGRSQDSLPHSSHKTTKGASLRTSVGRSSSIIGLFSRASQGFGFVDIGNKQPDIFIPPESQLNATNGDRVEVILRRQRQSGGRPSRTRGRIVKIIERGNKQFLGRLVRGKQVTLAMPLNELTGLPPVIILPDYDLETAKSGDFIEGSLISIEGSNDLYGKINRVFPTNSIDELAFDLILTENDIAKDFSQEALKEAESYPQRVTYNSQSGRKDLRELPFVTIDGEDARDFDDAVFVEKQSSDSYRLYVSIADVAHYVKPQQILDQEAYKRGTSTYFPTHAIPMLPEALSNHLCSLRPNVNRYTLTCEMEINAQGEVLHYEIYESVIRSHARLTYTDVSAFLEKQTTSIRNPTVQQSLYTMDELAKILSKKRYHRGAIDFSFPEYQAILNENREVTGFQKSYQSISMGIIEQFMLEANETVSRYCTEHNLPSLYRVHEKPDLIKLEKLQNTFWFFGIPFKPSQFQSPTHINKLLKKIKGHPNSDQLQVLLLKCMALACYRTENEGHFGLAAEFYAHFTSPIRRFPDLIVHRAIKKKLHNDQIKKKTKPEKLSPDIASYLSQQERRSETAQRQSFDLVKTIFMESYIGHTLTADVTSITPSGMMIEFNDFYLQTFIPLEGLTDDYYKYDDKHLTLVGSRKNKTVQVGKKLSVIVTNTDRIQRLIELKLESWIDEKSDHEKINS